jgi:eukaryotic-like serine/threonine-protein kinase
MNNETEKISAELVEMIFSAALTCPAAQRAAYLAEACGDNLELRQRVEALLRAEETCKGFLPEQPGSDLKGRHVAAVQTLSLCGTQAFTPAEKPGDCIGRYKLLEALGEGGFGVVYVAEQREPVKRRVALKIIKVNLPCDKKIRSKGSHDNKNSRNQGKAAGFQL